MKKCNYKKERMLRKEEEKYHKQAERAMKKDEAIHDRLDRVEDSMENSSKSKRTPVKKKKIARVMDEFKDKKLRSGSKNGPLVTNEKQAIAIALSEARKGKTGKKKKKYVETTLIR